MRKTLLMVPVFLLGFLVTAAALHLVPRDNLRLYAEHRSEKLAMLDAMRGSADIAAFGSSHLHCGFDPRAFDATMRAKGALPPGSKSVNLAVQGGSQTEQRAMALAYLRSMKENGKRPRLIILELTAGANFTNDHLVHPRAINIYDLDTLRFAFSLADPSLPTKQRLGRETFALAGASLYALNVGMVSNRVFGHELDTKVIEQNTGDDRRGLKTGRPNIQQAEEIKEIFAQSVGKPTTEQAVMVAGNRRLVDDLASAAREMFGAQGVPRFSYLVAPLSEDRKRIVVYPDGIETSVGRVPIVDVARVDRYPDLFKAPLWLDPAHVNADGARRMTEIFADALAQRESSNAVR